MLPRVQTQGNIQTESSSLEDSEANLIAFEEKYKNIIHLDTKEQLIKLLELVAMKDNAQRRISGHLLDSLAAELIANERVPEMCSKDLRQLLTVFATFKTLGKCD